MQVVKRVSKQYLAVTVWCVKFKLTGLVGMGVELIKRKYLHPNAPASTHTTVTISTTSITTIAAKVYATTINTTSTTTITTIKTKGIKVKNSGYA